jgi:hypothetical protein
MTRRHLAQLMALIVAVPAAAATAFFASSPQPCFVQGADAYRLTGSTAADYTIRIDDQAAHPNLRLALVDDPARADFVLAGDGDAEACRGVAVKSIRVETTAAKPDVTVALSDKPADASYRIYVRSADFTARQAAALFAVMWKTARGHEFLARR